MAAFRRICAPATLLGLSLFYCGALEAAGQQAPSTSPVKPEDAPGALDPQEREEIARVFKQFVEGLVTAGRGGNTEDLASLGPELQHILELANLDPALLGGQAGADQVSEQLGRRLADEEVELLDEELADVGEEVAQLVEDLELDDAVRRLSGQEIAHDDQYVLDPELVAQEESAGLQVRENLPAEEASTAESDSSEGVVRRLSSEESAHDDQHVFDPELVAQGSAGLQARKHLPAEKASAAQEVEDRKDLLSALVQIKRSLKGIVDRTLERTRHTRTRIASGAANAGHAVARTARSASDFTKDKAGKAADLVKTSSQNLRSRFTRKPSEPKE